MTGPDYVLAGFADHRIDSDHGDVFMRIGGYGQPLLLLHGFPETHLMWHAVAPILAQRFTVILADLPGYGQSDPPSFDDDGHGGMSKRAMARSLVAAMAELGYRRFAVVGHDRGGRIAYRMALDHQRHVERLAVLDVVPTYDVWDRADARFALAFWPFSLLAQPAPLPERLIAGAPDAIVDDALSAWGTPAACFPDWLRAAYVAALRDPAHVHAICEEYRAAASVDREHDEADRDAGRRIACPLLALWSASGGLANWYGDAGGPIGLWQGWADDVHGEAVEGGHFFPEELPEITARLLGEFLAA